MNKEDCEGCYSLRDDKSCFWFDEDLTCPCASCIVKPMCKVSCKLLYDYMLFIGELRKDKS